MVVGVVINRNIMRQLSVQDGLCYLPRCTEKLPSTTRSTPWVQYTLDVKRVGESIKLVPSIRATSLIAALWLQFSEYVSGSRRIRRCEECKQFMDVTECVRPGAKRVHDRCSHTACVRRWRMKQQES